MSDEVLEAIVGSFYKILDDLQEIKAVLSTNKCGSLKHEQCSFEYDNTNHNNVDHRLVTDRCRIQAPQYSQLYPKNIQQIQPSQYFYQSRLNDELSPQNRRHGEPVRYKSNLANKDKYPVVRKTCTTIDADHSKMGGSINKNVYSIDYPCKESFKSGHPLSKTHLSKDAMGQNGKVEKAVNSSSCRSQDLILRLPKKNPLSLNSQKNDNRKDENLMTDFFLTQNPTFIISKSYKHSTKRMKKICNFKPNTIDQQESHEKVQLNKWFEMVEKEVEEAL